MRTLRWLVPAGAVTLIAACSVLSKRAPELTPPPNRASSTPTADTAPDEQAGSEEASAHVHRTKTVVLDFSGETVEGDLSKPDGESVEARKRVKHSNDLRVREQLGPQSATTETKPPPVAVLTPPVADPRELPSLLQSPGQPTPTPEEPKAGYFVRSYGVNPTVETAAERFSTFGADVDTASYTQVRAALERGHLPPEGAVRVEEVVNAFDYGYRPPDKEAFAVQVEAFPSPNRKGYHLLHVGVKAKEVSKAQRKPAHLVFTIDVSGSMEQPNRLPLAKQALALLVRELGESDRISIVVYGTSARVALPPTSAANQDVILAAIDGLRSEGSTNVQAGLELAYEQALRAFRPGGINRVVLLSDGVANNGVTDAPGLWAKVKAKASEGVTLSTVGFGMGEYNDTLMERLADDGDGNYAYVDKLEEAQRIFVENLTGTLQVVAKDVKLQLEFNPAVVERYRLLGYENRGLSKRDFANDRVDSGELGAGHAVTAIYELKLKHRDAESFATFRARFKAPEGGASQLIEKALPMHVVRDTVAAATPPARLSLVAAGFAEKLRGSYWARTLSYQQLLSQLDGLPDGLRAQPRVQELRRLVTAAAAVDLRPDRFEAVAPVAAMDFDRLPVLQ